MKTISAPPVFFPLVLMFLSMNFGAILVEAENYHIYPPLGEPVVRVITIRVDNRLDNIPEIITRDEKPAEVPPLPFPVLKYFYIEPDIPVREAVIEFRVPRQWLERHHVPENEVALMRLNGDWDEFQPQLMESTENYVYYVVTVQDISMFAVVGYPMKEEILPHVFLVVVGVVTMALIYWFLVKPRKRFVSLKKLEKATGEKIFRGTLEAKKEIGPEFEEKVEKIKPTRRRVTEREEDVRILRKLKYEAERRRK
jgi:hypothetical protein